MKSLPAVISLAVCCFIVPIQGQTTGKDPSTHGQQSANTQTPKHKDPATGTVNIDTVNVDKFNVPQQPDAAGKAEKDNEKPPTYLYRLVAPETLPNTILCLIGIAGVFAAFYTLRAMKEQAGLMKRQADEMEKQRSAMDGQLGIMQSQLGQMESSGVQTEELIKSAQKSADAAKISADIVAKVSVPTRKIRSLRLAL